MITCIDFFLLAADEFMPISYSQRSHLAGGTWHRLTEDGVSGEVLDQLIIIWRMQYCTYCRNLILLLLLHLPPNKPLVPMDKYVITEITPYLVIDAQHVPHPRPLDDEEDIEIVRGISADQILQMIREGDFNLVGGWGALLALEKLRELGEIV